MNAYNPYLPGWEYVPDGEPRVFNDRVYIYGSHDRFGGEDYCENDYVCWSAPLSDLSDWRYDGVIYKKTQDPRNPDGKMHMCAPDCVQGRDGRYYLYYQLHVLQCTCVAVADHPAGPFEYYGAVQHPDGTPWGEKKGDAFVFDPGVLVDDDGRVYLYAGFSPKGFIKILMGMRGSRLDGAVCMELESDMKTVRGGEHLIVPGYDLAKKTEFDGHAFFEASSIRKVNGKYCYVYSSILSHELCYAYSEYPDRGFHFGGTLISIGDLGYKGNTKPLNWLGNTHGGMAEINGQWYIFYHRQTNRLKCNRQGCAEKLTIHSDGMIEQSEMTSCGLNGGPLNAKGVYEARIACNLNGRDGIISSDGARKKDKKMLYPYFTQSTEDSEENSSQYIANLKRDAWAGFKYFAFDGTESRIKVTVRSGSGAILAVHTDLNKTPAALISIEPDSDWKEFSADLKTYTGVTPLYFVVRTDSCVDFLSFEIE